MLPDTQCYSLFYPGIFHSQGRFAARLAERSSVFHLVHVGDITDLNSHAEWEVARSALGPVTDIISPTLVTGNHDLGPGGSAADRTTLLDEYFSNLYFESTFDESIQNSASLVGDDWLVVGLEFAPRPEVLDWANAVIADHPDRFVLIATHAYLFEEGRRYDSASQPYHPSDYVVGDEGAAQIEPFGELVDPHRLFRSGILDRDQDQVLSRRQVGKAREQGAGGLQAAAEGEIIVEEAAKHPVSILVEQLGF